jgi:uncharacterized repeat protein (TIGR03837 family)
LSDIFLTEAPVQKRWDIFCKVVDNFGDIGICWRLTQQLHLEHGLQIRLWVDDLDRAQKIIPSLNINLNQQLVDDIAIFKWSGVDKDDDADFSQAASVVIEAFACGLPCAYLASMAQQKSKWVNLEYLSAETWVDDFHAKPSPKPDGLIRHFYFPGFTEKTGGLIRTPDVFHKNQLLADNVHLQDDFWESLRLSNHPCLKVSLFCYPFAPVQQLLSVMAQLTQPIHCYISDSNIFAQVAQFFGQESIHAGQALVQQNLTLHVLPFLSQADYDNLLAACDLNFVRGEDSWIRAIWAAKPFIWQPYIQDENAHMVKLNAFLDLFYANYDKKYLPCKAHEYWSAGQQFDDVFIEYMQHLPAIKSYTQQQSAQLASQPDLAAKLVIFCNALYNP